MLYIIAVTNASVAQLVEQRTENPRVVGSIPTGGTIYRDLSRFADLAHLVERDLAKVEVAGSSPVIRSIWEHSSVGRASALQAEGHRFEPYCSHHSLEKSSEILLKSEIGLEIGHLTKVKFWPGRSVG